MTDKGWGMFSQQAHDFAPLLPKILAERGDPIPLLRSTIYIGLDIELTRRVVTRESLVCIGFCAVLEGRLLDKQTVYLKEPEGGWKFDEQNKSFWELDIPKRLLAKTKTDEAVSWERAAEIFIKFRNKYINRLNNVWIIADMPLDIIGFEILLGEYGGLQYYGNEFVGGPYITDDYYRCDLGGFDDSTDTICKKYGISCDIPHDHDPSNDAARMACIFSLFRIRQNEMKRT